MSRIRFQSLALAGGAVLLVASVPASAGFVIDYFDPSGLGAQAEFALDDGGTTLVVRLRNTSTGVPDWFDNSDQILTSISWDFAALSPASSVQITGGSVRTGPTSQSINFDILDVGPDEDVSGEYGYGNSGTTGLFPNFLTAMQAGSTPFGGDNLDGPAALDGPQGGLVANPVLVPLGGLGAIQDEIIARLSLSEAISDLSFLEMGTTVEFGSDAFFITVPAPAALALVALAGLPASRRRRTP